MKPLARSILIVLIFVLLASCASSTPVSTATQPVTVELATPVFTSTPTSIPTSKPTERPKSAVDEIFALPTIGIIPGETPTPIATPAFQDTSAILREMSEKDYLELIRRMNEYSYENYPPDGWWYEGMFNSAQIRVALVIQEYLYRFPDSPNAERLRWQLALINSIAAAGGNQYRDAWMLSELQRRLEQGEVSPDHLGEILGQYSFEVAHFQSIENLFQDGKTGWLYGVTPLVLKDYWFTKDSGLFFVVRKAGEGDFQIYLLNSAWNFSFADNSVFEVSDHNQNGTPEIALYIGAHSGTMCDGNLLIYEWNKTAFVELTKGKIGIRDCFDDYKYYTDKNGKPSILYSGYFLPRTTLFAWNGKYYEPEIFVSDDPLDNWKNSISLIPDEAEALEAILSSDRDHSLTRSQVNFLRFRLGLVYALDSKTEKARSVLQDLVDHPRDKSLAIYPDLAGNFLKYYLGDASLLLACEQSRNFLHKTESGNNTGVLDESESGNSMDAFRKSIGAFGYPISSHGEELSQCSDGDVFEHLIRKMPASVKDVSEELRKNGMELLYIEKQDLNLDAVLEEWLVVFDNGIYAVFPNGSFYETVELDWFAGDVPSYSKAKVEIGKWNGIQEPVLKILNDGDLRIIRIGDDYSPVSTDIEFAFKDIAFQPSSNPPQYQVFHSKPVSENEYSEGPWKGYRWDFEKNKFTDDLFEYSIFVEQDLDKALQISKTLLPMLEKWKDVSDVRWTLARYYYLCGLSYELAGDRQSAAKIYWQLWHDFPESQYALMAKYKLEPVAP